MENIPCYPEKGYKTVTKSFKFTALKIDGMFPEGEDGEPWVSDGILYVFCTPKLDGKDFVIKVDGTEVKPKDAFLSGDGFCYLGGCYRTFRRRA